MKKIIFNLLVAILPAIGFGQTPNQIAISYPTSLPLNRAYSSTLSVNLTPTVDFLDVLQGYNGVKTYTWAKISGPNSVSFSTTTEKNTTVTDLVQGEYWFHLIVGESKDGINYWNQIYVILNVTPPPSNTLPTITIVGTTENVTLSSNEGTLSAIVSDPDGSVVSTFWSRHSGPTTGFTIASPSALTTPVTFTSVGVYIFKITATDNSGGVSTQFATINVTDGTTGTGGGWTSSGNYLYNTNNTSGTILIGTQSPLTNTTIPPNTKLAVNGNLLARKLTVNQETWADYVFNKSYQLPKLPDVEKYILANKHLPEIPSTQQIQKNGLDVGNTQELLLKKIEELTLYMIEQNKKSDQQLAMIKGQQQSIQLLKRKLSRLQKQVRN